jgi:hypothetical protein
MATARSAKAYCRSRDSRFSRTCCGVDCRTYTTAKRTRWQSRILADRNSGIARESTRSVTLGGPSFDSLPVIGHPLCGGDRLKPPGDESREDSQSILLPLGRECRPKSRQFAAVGLCARGGTVVRM